MLEKGLESSKKCQGRLHLCSAFTTKSRLGLKYLTVANHSGINYCGIMFYRKGRCFIKRQNNTAKQERGEGATALTIMTLSKMTFSIKTLSIKTLSIKTLSIKTLSIKTLSIKILSIKTP